MVQVHYGEGIANHTGPEPCVIFREGGGEASAGVRIGQPLSHEIAITSGADAVSDAEGKTNGCAIASVRSARRGRRPWHVRTLLVREPGDLASDRGRQVPPSARIGKVRSRSR